MTIRLHIPEQMVRPIMEQMNAYLHDCVRIARITDPIERERQLSLLVAGYNSLVSVFEDKR